MPCLLIDTSASRMTLGVTDRTGRLLAAAEIDHTRENSMRLSELVSETLEGVGISIQELELVCVGCGPGSFIGTRTGVAFANGLASAGLKVLAVGSMEAAAALPALNVRHVYIIRSARRHSVFAGVYRKAETELQTIGESEVALKGISDIFRDAMQSSCDNRVQLITDCKTIYEEAADYGEFRAAIVFKPSIVDLRGMAALTAERWDSASCAVNVRYLRSAV
jgi:tRNA threonylcarbamoyl adenosine modification protein YeaZ